MIADTDYRALDSPMHCLEQLEALYQAVDNAAIIAVTDVRGTIISVNDNFCSISGYSRDELIGSNHRLVRSTEHPTSFFREMYRTIARGQVWRGEICNQAKNGTLYWVDTTIVPMFNDCGRLDGYLALRIDSTDQKRLTNELYHLAHRDPLTGLANRSSVLSSIQDCIDRYPSTSFAVLFLDFDRFKLVNDSLGHDVGDMLLQVMAMRLRVSVKDWGDILVARLGGDEFVVLVDCLDNVCDAELLASRLLDVLSQRYHLGMHDIYCSASIGITTSEHGYQSARDVLRDADVAMYNAKSAGRGRYAFFDHAQRDAIRERMDTEEDLRDAVDRQQLQLHYQPIVSLDTGRLHGVEALVRWQHPKRGRVNPDDFIPIAEETGLIIPIGSWVIDEACRQLACWREQFGTAAPACMHVNVSRMQLLDDSIIELVKESLGTHRLPADRLHLEVTESVVIENPETVNGTLGRLRDLGVNIDMDDFGSGYSSLSCIYKFPINTLKIDRTFVSDVERVRELAALLHAITTLADNLGLDVIAEGIENSEQLALLQSLGCGFGQGYFFSKPLPAAEFNWFEPSQHFQGYLPAI